MKRIKPPPGKGRRKLPQWLWIALSAVISAILFTTWLAVNATVPTASMAPTIRAGQFVFGWRLAYLRSAPARGDIVILRHPDLADQLLVKRVVAVGGDTVAIGDGILYVNGLPQTEPYATVFKTQNVATLSVPMGFCYVLGDNRAASNDSSCWADPFVPVSELVAKVLWIYG